MGSSFSCSTSLCYNGGTCVADNSSISACTCPPSFQHDFSLYHDLNCALPSNAYLGNFVVSCVITLTCSAVLISRLRAAKRTIRKTVLANLVFLESILLLNLSVYLQSGWYEAASAFFIVLCVAFCLYVYLVVRIVVLPLVAFFPGAQKKLDLGLRVLIPLFATVPCALLMAMAAESHSNDLTYNALVNALLLQITAYFVILIGCVEVATYMLIHAIKGSADSATTRKSGAANVMYALTAKVRGIQATLRVGCVLVASVALVFPSVHLALSSFPYCFVLVFFFFSLVFPAASSAVTISLTASRPLNLDVTSGSNSKASKDSSHIKTNKKTPRRESKDTLITVGAIVVDELTDAHFEAPTKKPRAGALWRMVGLENKEKSVLPPAKSAVSAVREESGM